TLPGPEDLGDADRDLQKWLKEAENAESLMDEMEAKTDSLQAKVDALLAEVNQQNAPQVNDADKK
ncbi:hypothetical protein BCR43DRAFT_403768, partial [Syncephalastrum racemosum]